LFACIFLVPIASDIDYVCDKRNEENQ
jgi:hypothetical protein